MRTVYRTEDMTAKQEEAKARLWEITAGVAHTVGQEIDSIIRRLHEHYLETGDSEILAAKEALKATRANVVRWYALAQTTRGLYYEQGYFFDVKGED